MEAVEFSSSFSYNFDNFCNVRVMKMQIVGMSLNNLPVHVFFFLVGSLSPPRGWKLMRKISYTENKEVTFFGCSVSSSVTQKIQAYKTEVGEVW